MTVSRKRVFGYLSVVALLAVAVFIGRRVQRAMVFAELVTAVDQSKCSSVGGELRCPNDIRCTSGAGSTEAVAIYSCSVRGAAVILSRRLLGSERFVCVTDFRNYGPDVCWLTATPGGAGRWKYSLVLP